MNCAECNSDDMEIFDTFGPLFGFPKYWLGGTPMEPEKAEKYFCGSKCATAYYTREFYIGAYSLHEFYNGKTDK